MRLAFAIFRYFPFGGLQRDMLAMAQEAQLRGHQVTIFCGEWRGEKPKKIDVVLVSGDGFFARNSVESFVRNFQQTFQRNNFDLLVGFNKMPGLGVYFTGDSCFAQKAYAERNIFYRLTPRARLYLAYENAVFGEASSTQIFSIADAERKYFTRYYSTPPERFHSLPPGISRAQFACRNQAARKSFRSEWNADDSTSVILCVGSGFKTKGVDRSIAAFAELQSQHPKKYILVIAGSDNAKPYLAQAQQLGVSKRVIFLGGRNDIADVFQAADVLLHPAYRELAGNVILEAMAAGVPVITTDVCGFAHYVSAQHMGIVLKTPYRQEECVNALLQVLSTTNTIWHDRAERFSLTADIFSRQSRAIDLLETLVSQPRDAAKEWVAETAQHTIILRDELIAHWSGQDIFALVHQLSGPVARELVDRQTLKFLIGNNGYYRKLHRGVGWREIFKNLLQLRLPILGAKNEWLALNKLRALGVPSLEPVAYGEQKNNPATKKSFIVTRELKDVIQLDHYFKQNPVASKEKIMLLREVARIARELHLAGINHRDFYLCHFMLDKNSIEQWRKHGVEAKLYIVDLHRAQIRRRVPRRWLIKDLSGLYFSSLGLNFTRYDYFRFMRVYWKLSLKSILYDHGPLLAATAQRAEKTYKRDFGVAPVLPFTNFDLKGK